MILRTTIVTLAAAVPALAGPWSLALDDPQNPHDAPVPGFVGPHGPGKARIPTGPDSFRNPENFVNPLFSGWAVEAVGFAPAPGNAAQWGDPGRALGPVSGDPFEVVSLGELDAAAIAGGTSPGSITLRFDPPIRDLRGADFAVFENGLLAGSDTGGAGVGAIFAELAFVEVSADGVNFTRFPARSLTAGSVGSYGTIDASDVFQLAGKHANAGGESWGTPFDLDVTGLPQATHVRLVDVPGNGSFADSTGAPIHDGWPTFGSGGADIDAVGAISVAGDFDSWPALAALPAEQRGEEQDPDGDGLGNLLEYAFATLPGQAQPSPVALLRGESGWALSFIRDERLVDLTYEVESSPDLVEWTVLARAEPGSPPVATSAGNVELLDESASDIASVGVLRRITLRDDLPKTPPARYYRVVVSRTP